MFNTQHIYTNIHQYYYQLMYQMLCVVTDETIAWSAACRHIHEVNRHIPSDMWWICIMLYYIILHYIITVTQFVTLLQSSLCSQTKRSADRCWYIPVGGWHFRCHYLNLVCYKHAKQPTLSSFKWNCCQSPCHSN